MSSFHFKVRLIIRAGFTACAVGAGIATASTACGAIPPAPAGTTTFSAQGFDFSLIGSPGNPAFSSEQRPSWYPVQGRGSVSYTFGLARTEVTTAQWLDFVNTFSTRGGSFTQFGQPIRWGARLDPTYSGPGWRWQLDPNRVQAAEVPVWGINWREAAMLCNWLQNGRSSDPASLMHGAYDTSTFGYPGNDFFNGFSDQAKRSPDAKFWIPNLDEWIKGSFYDAQQQRWWSSHYGSDTAPVYGLPGEPGAQSNAGLQIDVLNQYFYIPLTAYGTQSPFGLLSTSGGPAEWLEDAVGPSAATGLPSYRLFYQSDQIGIDDSPDLIYGAGASGSLPTSSAWSFRVATAIPSPNSAAVLLVLCVLEARQRRAR